MRFAGLGLMGLLLVMFMGSGGIVGLFIILPILGFLCEFIDEDEDE